MFFTYVLRSLKDNKKYIGSTSDLKNRLRLHNSGKVLSTKNRKPFNLVYFESFETMSEARWRERRFKKSHDVLERAIRKAKTAMGKEIPDRERSLTRKAAGPEGLWPGGR